MRMEPGSSVKQNNQPVYFFLGYFLKKASFSQDEFCARHFDVLDIKALNFAKEANKASFDISLTFSSKSFKAVYLFNAGFQINDEKWYDEFKDSTNELVAIFFSVVFPFIRQTIASSTNDNLGQINIPTIDMRFSNVCEGIKLTRAPSAKPSESPASASQPK